MAYFVYDSRSNRVACCDNETTAKRWAYAYDGWYILQRKEVSK